MEQSTPQKPVQDPKPVMDVTPPKSSPLPISNPPESKAAENGPVAVHKAPVDLDVDPVVAATPPTTEAVSAAHTSHAVKVPKTAHTPTGIVVVTIMVMLILCGLTVLVYLNA